MHTYSPYSYFRMTLLLMIYFLGGMLTPCVAQAYQNENMTVCVGDEIRLAFKTKDNITSILFYRNGGDTSHLVSIQGETVTNYYKRRMKVYHDYLIGITGATVDDSGRYVATAVITNKTVLQNFHVNVTPNCPVKLEFRYPVIQYYHGDGIRLYQNGDTVELGDPGRLKFIVGLPLAQPPVRCFFEVKQIHPSPKFDTASQMKQCNGTVHFENPGNYTVRIQLNHPLRNASETHVNVSIYARPTIRDFYCPTIIYGTAQEEAHRDDTIDVVNGTALNLKIEVPDARPLVTCKIKMTSEPQLTYKCDETFVFKQLGMYNYTVTLTHPAMREVSTTDFQIRVTGANKKQEAKFSQLIITTLTIIGVVSLVLLIAIIIYLITVKIVNKKPKQFNINKTDVSKSKSCNKDDEEGDEEEKLVDPRQIEDKDNEQPEPQVLNKGTIPETPV